MLWVFVFGGIALAGLVMLISYTVWLAHKTADVLSEVRMVGDRAAELADLLAQVQIPQSGSADWSEDQVRTLADDFASEPETYDDWDVALVASKEREL